MFTPGDASRTSSRLHELFVRAFSGDQVAQYFTQWVKLRDGSGDIGGGNADSTQTNDTVRVEPSARSLWSAERYVDVIKSTAGLQELAETPFVLRAMADALPRLDVQSSATGSRRVTRADVYGAFMEECWEVEARRLQRNWPVGLPADYDAALSYGNYCTDLAVDMLARGQVSRTRRSRGNARCR